MNEYSFSKKIEKICIFFLRIYVKILAIYWLLHLDTSLILNMLKSGKVRVYDLARELKQDTKRIIKELRREGADVKVPSNKVSENLADIIRSKYFVRKPHASDKPIKVVKKSLPEDNFESDTITGLGLPKPENRKIVKTAERKTITRADPKIKQNPENIEFSIRKQKIQTLENEIALLENRQRHVKKNLPASLFNSLLKNLEQKIHSKKSELKRLINEKSENKSQQKFETCPYCLADVSKKNLFRHTETKCPKKLKSSNNVPNISRETTLEKYDSTDTNMALEHLSWELLPEGEWLFKELTNHFRRLTTIPKWNNKPFDEERLEKIERLLKPNKCYIGKDEFDGYVVYCFNWTQHVLLECPVYGNAIYIINQGEFTWQEIAKATKWEARTKYSSQVKVINHSETWLERLEQNLRYGL
jgi:hypothetical protein